MGHFFLIGPATITLCHCNYSRHRSTNQIAVFLKSPIELQNCNFKAHISCTHAIFVDLCTDSVMLGLPGTIIKFVYKTITFTYQWQHLSMIDWLTSYSD